MKSHKTAYKYIGAILALILLFMPMTDVLSQVSTKVVYLENFASVTEPAIPIDWTQSGGATFGTYDTGDVPGKVLYGDTAYPYRPDTNSRAVSPTINLSGATSAVISFNTRCDTEYESPETTDHMSLLVSPDGSNFTKLTKWNEQSIDSDSDPSSQALKSFRDIAIPTNVLTSNFKFAINWATGARESTVDLDGCYIDDIEIKATGNFDGGSNDTTPPSISIKQVDSDTTSPYSTTNQNFNIVILGETNMECRWNSENAAFAEMQNSASIDGNEATISLTNKTNGDHTIYVSCKDNAGNISNNLTVDFSVNAEGGGGSETEVSECKTLSSSNTTYKLSENLSTSDSCIIIDGSNITLDGQNKLIVGDGGTSDIGIEIRSGPGHTLKNINISNFGEAVRLGAITTSKIEKNSMADAQYAIIARGGSNNIITENTVTNSANGIYIDGGETFTIENNTLNENEVGIFLNKGASHLLRNNDVTKSDRGILLIESNNNSLIENSTNENMFGLAFEIGSSKNNVSGHSASGNNYAISIGGPENALSNITINNTANAAIRFFDSTSIGNKIISSTISGTAESGLDLSFDAASGNTTDAGTDGTVIDNTSIGKYRIASAGQISIKNNLGEVSFTQDVSGEGILSNDIKIEFNKITLSGNTSFNAPAIITLNNIPRDGNNYAIFKNGSECTDCVALSPLDNGTVSFINSGIGQYSINFEGDTLPTDTTAPTVIINSPEGTVSAGSVQILISINEAGSCSYSLDNGATKKNMDSTDSMTFSATENLSNGNYTLRAYCQDTSGNKNENNLSNFTVAIEDTDTQAPTITLNSPINTTYSDGNISINAQINEAGICKYKINDGEVRTLTSSNNGTTFTGNIGLSDGAHNIEIICADSSQNSASLSRSFTIQTADQGTATITLSNLPPLSSDNENISVAVSGTGLRSYFYLLDDDASSEEFPLGTPINLTLDAGTHTLIVVGISSSDNSYVFSDPHTFTITQKEVSDSTVINVTNNSDIGLSNDSNLQTTIYIPLSFEGVPLRLADFSTSTSGATGTIFGPLIVQATTTFGSITLNMATSTMLTIASTTWDGKLFMPKSIENPLVAASQNATVSIKGAVEIGLQDAKIVLSKAARILFRNLSGNLAGFARAGSFSRIEDRCSADSQTSADALAPEGHCKIDVGNDLVIWTKHFTTFSVFSESFSNTDSNQNTGGSGGGGGSIANGPIFLTSNTQNFGLQGDLTGDGRIDISDFNRLMFLWLANDLRADINRNGRVDLIDFNLLMVNWSI